jgi:hypothetical protein
MSLLWLLFLALLPFLQQGPAKGAAGSTDVSVRRVMGTKKDQILVNQSPFSQQDFQALLESAGMSRSNPYYIVEQGKIAQLMKQKDEERLELFKEIAGTRTYDDRRKESLKIMKETDDKRKHIDQVIGVLDERITELESESAEFKKYQNADATRRSLEYALYERERELATNKLQLIDDQRCKREIQNAQVFCGNPFLYSFAHYFCCLISSLFLSFSQPRAAALLIRRARLTLLLVKLFKRLKRSLRSSPKR